ncbi:hypothetical protein BGZ83_006904 [Gryganskiella cystojenkinii]|nr:hypothetical protein BGZ83_006904 [Gryganskiella cystojenkinii]
MGSSGPSSPDDENNGLDPSSTASQSTTTTKTKPRPTSSSISSSSGYSNEQDNSITGSGSDNGSNSPNSDTNGRSGKTNNNDQNGNAEGLTPGLIALLVMLALAITAAILLSCYKIRQARNRSIKRRVRGASITSGMNLVGPSSGRASSVAREADMESQFNSWRGSDLSKSTFSSPHLQHLRQHSHPYVSHSAPATPPMAAAHIASNVARGSPRGSLGSGGHGGARFSPDRGSLGGGRDDPWRRV